jgi:hypothetical protein
MATIAGARVQAGGSWDERFSYERGGPDLFPAHQMSLDAFGTWAADWNSDSTCPRASLRMPAACFPTRLVAARSCARECASVSNGQPTRQKIDPHARASSFAFLGKWVEDMAEGREVQEFPRLGTQLFRKRSRAISDRPEEGADVYGR